MIILVANYTTKPGKSAQVLNLLRDMAQHVMEKEAGCKMYQISVGRDNENAIVLYEQYVDEAALQEHRETPHFQSYVLEQIVPLLEKREATLYNLAIE